MKFNVEKFNNLTNNSNYYRDWDNELLQMFDVLDCLPTYTDKKHYLIYEIRRFTYLHIGFDDDGNIDFLIEYQGRQHYEPSAKFGGKKGFY